MSSPPMLGVSKFVSGKTYEFSTILIEFQLFSFLDLSGRTCSDSSSSSSTPHLSPFQSSICLIHILPEEVVRNRMQLDELRVYSCFRCGNIVSRQEDIVSTSFQSGNHRAFLFSHAKNILIGTEEEKELITGLHKVCDVYCSDCGLVLGWMYVEAYTEDQKYKEGKVCLDQFKVLKQSL